MLLAVYAPLGLAAQSRPSPRPSTRPAQPVAVPAADMPSALTLAARHDSLVGGRAVLAGLTSLKFLGSFSVPSAGIEAPLEILKRSPNQFVYRTVLGEGVEVVQGYDGRIAWSIRPGQGARVLDGEERDQIVQQADFFGDLHDYSRFASAETTGAIEFEGRPAWEVRLVRPAGDTLYEFFDRETGLAAGGAVDVRTGLGRERRRTLLGDYKVFGQLRIATTIIQRQPDFDIIIRIAFVEVDTVREMEVALPDAVRALVTKPQ